ncbi:hypothetical protein GYMLUDRAFT_249815 [Collybiopsis luxurians FD-317 M1]|uniref:Helitron helicase-like domain-containing protein n=1 Tax=Collybiopsis luxurians FD-317 M1 TaxID=944289 RepID=A0A0D0AU75_9AGAR|nr:hypothetical protein GYMLUDRAFT_249815 [Collybiopsis luxurians FD-317 M1]
MSFPFIAFSHEQIKAGTMQAFILANSKQFNDISSQLLSVDQSVLQELTSRMAAGEFVKPSNESEQKCFALLRDLDQGSSKTKGSVYSKRIMQHEIWSLVTHIGGPTWYFTMAPCNFKHPLCIYYADTKQKFDVPLQTNWEHQKLLSHNPAAAARFFHFMVTLFLDIVVGTEQVLGLFGPTAAYYSFTKKKLSPLEIKQQVLDPASDFQNWLVAYLESIRVGEFLTGSKLEVMESIKIAESSPSYVSPELTLPVLPPPSCKCNLDSCKLCTKYADWSDAYKFTVDDLLMKLNVHDCNRAMNADGTVNWDKFEVSCLNNKYHKCKAQFPRTIYKETTIDLTTGHISLKKLEQWLNDISPGLTYLMRCNTDVTCLLSGTAIKAVVCYVADYITKTSLKTHIVFDSIKAIFDKNTELLNGSQLDKEKCCQLLTQMVNLLSMKLELGGPMVCMYLLQNPDYYTSHVFVPFYWKTFVLEAQKYWHKEDPKGDNKVVLICCKGKMIGLSSTFDYTHRPNELDSYKLYKWLRRFNRVKIRKTSHSVNVEDSAHDGDSSDDECLIPMHLVPPTKADKPPGQLHFLAGHPLHDTHAVSVNCQPETVVPNFIGPPLPQPDKGNRKYYCAAMLTFFCPWRLGKDLKTEHQLWDEAFHTYKFSEEDTQHIKNINL